MEAEAGRARWGDWSYQSQNRGLNRTTRDPLSGVYSLPDSGDASHFPRTHHPWFLRPFWDHEKSPDPRILGWFIDHGTGPGSWGKRVISKSKGPSKVTQVSTHDQTPHSEPFPDQLSSLHYNPSHLNKPCVWDCCRERLGASALTGSDGAMCLRLLGLLQPLQQNPPLTGLMIAWWLPCSSGSHVVFPVSDSMFWILIHHRFSK